VFANVFGGGRSYAVYVLSGLVCWTFFAQTTSDAMHNLIWGGSLLRRIYIPRTVFAVSATLTGLINLGFALAPLLVVMLITGTPIRWSMLVLPVPALFLAMFALGVGLLLSTVAIYFADVTEMYNILLTAWMYLSPVIYTVEMLPQEYLWVVKLNPMYYLINLFRAPIYEGVIPPATDFLLAGGISLIVLLAGWFLFAAKADEFAYRV
jgi:ABC-2 type transport system permease protein